VNLSNVLRFIQTKISQDLNRNRSFIHFRDHSLHKSLLLLLFPSINTQHPCMFPSLNEESTMQYVMNNNNDTHYLHVYIHKQQRLHKLARPHRRSICCCCLLLLLRMILYEYIYVRACENEVWDEEKKRRENVDDQTTTTSLNPTTTTSLNSTTTTIIGSTTYRVGTITITTWSHISR
jgi:hypothetical protein